VNASVGGRKARLHQAPVLSIIRTILSNLPTLSLIVNTSPMVGTRDDNTGNIRSSDGVGKVIGSSPGLSHVGGNSQHVIVADRGVPDFRVSRSVPHGSLDTCAWAENTRGVEAT
jgi:hypothetical protein